MFMLRWPIIFTGSCRWEAYIQSVYCQVGFLQYLNSMILTVVPWYLVCFVAWFITVILLMQRKRKRNFFYYHCVLLYTLYRNTATYLDVTLPLQFQQAHARKKL